MPGTFSYAAATNTVTVTGGTSGSPADFASCAAADRAGAGTSLLVAWAPNSNTKALTYQVRPVELLALLISFAVAGKTAETDYIFITGTDAWGNPQTEAINVSAGNGTYITTKRFRTITNIDCSDSATGGGTVWANGTVAVTQPIWGVIWELIAARAYRIAAKMVIGDAVTTTYFMDTNKSIKFKDSLSAAGTILYISRYATFQLGTMVDTNNKTTRYGCNIQVCEAYGATIDNHYGTLYLYGGGILTSDNAISFYGAYAGTARIWNCLYNGPIQHQYCYEGWDLFNITSCGYSGPFAPFSNCRAVTERVLLGGMVNYYPVNITTGNPQTIKDMVVKDATGNYFYLYRCTLDSYVINCIMPTSNWLIYFDAGFYTVGKLFRQYTIDLKAVDVNGIAIASAVVLLKDNTGATVFSLSTGADGKIAQQTVSRGWYRQDFGNTMQDYSPHTLTINAPGYQTYRDVITIDRKMDLEVALLALGGGISPTTLGLVPLGTKQVAI